MNTTISLVNDQTFSLFQALKEILVTKKNSEEVGKGERAKEVPFSLPSPPFLLLPPPQPPARPRSLTLRHTPSKRLDQAKNLDKWSRGKRSELFLCFRPERYSKLLICALMHRTRQHRKENRSLETCQASSLDRLKKETDHSSTSPQRLPWGQKKVAVIARLKQESMYGLYAKIVSGRLYVIAV